MAHNDSQQQQDTGNKTHNYQLVLSIMAPIAVLLLTIYLGNEFRVLENQLRYMPPVNQQSGGSVDDIEIVEGQTVYVPAYSHIYSRGGEPHLLEVTLSIRNTDPERAIRLAEVRYFNTRGQLVKNYLDGVLELGPLETVEFLVEAQDKQGGSGANFIVTWDADEPVYEPIIEAIMIGLSKEYSISFITPARVLASRIEK
jgi:hypothetical protein